MTDIAGLADLQERLQNVPVGQRFIVGIAGAPGSGKSTLADQLVQGLNENRTDCAAVVPMDGFHLDDMVLNERGWRARKGAPHTFDVAGLDHLLGRMRRNLEAEIAIPVFDRNIEIARAGARFIPQSVDIILVEGNYLLLDQAAWSGLKQAFDLTVMISVEEDELKRRLQERWVRHGLPPQEIEGKLEENDMPNGRLVADASHIADVILKF
ncbi:MAG: nucleoside triphosphate hydrolase [Paracoccaceae bacterium]